MASGALIPKRSDVMNLVSGQSIHDLSPQVPIGEPGDASDIHQHIQKHSKQPRYIRRDSGEMTSPIRRSTSAQSVNSSYAKNRHHYQKCIEYLQDQHRQTLTKLHQEVQDLKHENKKLNFKILVEDEGGVESVVKQTLSINTDKTNISSSILLQETIKDLKVKLNLSEDSVQHQQATIRALNKQVKMLKRVPHPPPERSRRVSSPADLGPIKNELAEKAKIIAALEAERDLQRQRIDELQLTVHHLRSATDDGRDRHLVANIHEIQAHPGMPRNNVANFVVTNSAPLARHNIVNGSLESSSSLKTHQKLPPLAKTSNVSSPNSGSPRASLVPKNSRVDIAKRSKRIQQIRQNNVELNEDYLL